MKKILQCLISSLLVIGLCGCTKKLTNDEIETKISETDYKMQYYDEYSSMAVYSKSDDHRFTYYGEEDKLVYINRPIKAGKFYLDDNKLISDDGKEIEDESGKIKSQFNEAKDIALNELGISKDQLKTFMKEKLNEEATKYDALSSKEKLKEQYSFYGSDDDVEKVEELSDADAEVYYEQWKRNMPKKDGFYSFNNLATDVFLADKNTPIELSRIVNNMIQKKDNSKTKWEMENFRNLNTDDLSAAVFDWYLSYEDTYIDFMFLYNPTNGKFTGACLNAADAYFKVDDVEDILVMYMVLMQCVDESIDGAMALNIANRCYNKDYHHNGWIYNMSLDDDLTMMIVPE